MWWLAGAGGAACVASGLLPWHDTTHIAERVGPILLFLAAVTVVAELADAAGVFDVAATRAARLGGGITWRLFAAVLALGSLTTIVLSLDTTAVLLTPVVIALATRLRIAVVPFAMAAVWLANTASLLLPVSNLTNLLATAKLDMPASEFASRMALPALGAIAVTALVLGITYRRELRGSYAMPPAFAVADRWLLRAGSGVCIVLAPLFVSGLPVEYVATGGAIALAATFAWRRRESLRFSLIPWRLLIGVAGLFAIVATLGVHGLDDLLASAAGTSDSAAGIARTAGVGAATSNVFNNLPSYIAIERVTDGRPDQLLGLLLGTNLGPLILLWGSLATILWRERCKARGVHVGAWEFARVGLVGVPLLLAVSYGLLLATR